MENIVASAAVRGARPWAWCEASRSAATKARRARLSAEGGKRAGPVTASATERVTRESVRRALRSALERVLSWQIAEIAIPPLGLGAGNLDIDESAELMADELARHLATAAFPKRVTLIAETPDEALVLEGAIARRVDA